MFQFEFVAVLFRLRARGPSFRPLLQLPNRRATARGDTDSFPCYLFTLYIEVFPGGIVLTHTPRPPRRLCRQVVTEGRRPRCPSSKPQRCCPDRGREDHQTDRRSNYRTEGRQPLYFYSR